MRHSIYILSLLLLIACQRDPRSLVVGKIQSASKLASTEFTIDKIVHGTKELKWGFKINETTFLGYSQAKVKAGIDLNKITYDDIKIDEHHIEITLPPVEVINFSYPPSSFEIDEEISDTRKLLNTISVEDQEIFFRNAEVNIRDNLEHMGIVETTQQHTRTILQGLLKALGYTEIYIRFKNDDLIIDKVDLSLINDEDDN